MLVRRQLFICAFADLQSFLFFLSVVVIGHDFGMPGTGMSGSVQPGEIANFSLSRQRSLMQWTVHTSPL